MIKSLRDWDNKSSHAEFAHNRTPCAASHFLFEVCYGLSPLTSLDLIFIPQESKVNLEAEQSATEIKRLHEQVRAQPKKANKQYKPKANKKCTHLGSKLGDLHGYTWG